MVKPDRDEKLVYIKTSMILGVILAIFLVWLWWARIYTSKGNVFNAMLSNSLSMYGVSKEVSQDGASGKMTQVSQAQFGAVNIVDIKTDIEQTTEQGDVKVTTRTLATPTEDFVRYSSIDMPTAEGKAKIDFSPLLNEWGRTSKVEGGGSTFSQAVFGMVPFGNLPADKRNQLLNIIHSKDVYKTDFSKTEIKNENGRIVYAYPVEVNVQAYAELLKTYDEMLGLKQMEQLNPDDYASAEPIKATLTADKLSRTLVKIVYGEGGQEESFSGYGVHQSVEVPETTTSRQEIESKLQKLLNGAQ